MSNGDSTEKCLLTQSVNEGFKYFINEKMHLYIRNVLICSCDKHNLFLISQNLSLYMEAGSILKEKGERQQKAGERQIPVAPLAALWKWNNWNELCREVKASIKHCSNLPD